MFNLRRNGFSPRKSARIFAGAGRSYWFQAFPAARAAQRRLLSRAEAIPDPLLREDALTSHRQKRSNSEGLAAMAVLAPSSRRADLARSLVSYQLMLDYLDGVSERPCDDPIANGLCLHRAFEVALDPEAEHDDFYAHAAAREDGGYLAALIESCRAPLTGLPSYPAVRKPLLRQARLCRESQALNHARHFVAMDEQVNEWAVRTAAGCDLSIELEWWELLAAAAASSLGIGALLALAARPGAGELDAHRVEAAYFPWASGLNALLDSLVDLDEDPEEASHLRRYGSLDQAAERLGAIASSARERVSTLPDGEVHEAILAAMGTIYLVRPEAWRPGRDEVAERVLAALGPFAGPSLAVHLLRRCGRGGPALVAARRRARRRSEVHTVRVPMSESSQDEERRLREALLDLCAERGYANLELSALLDRAGIDRAAFERHYASLDACFGAVLGQVYEEFFTSAQKAVAGERGWRDRMRATAYAILRFLRRDERVAHLAAVDAQDGGEEAQQLFLETFNRLVDLIDEGSAEATGPDSPSRATALGVGGVVFARIQEAVAEGELGLGEEEIPELMYGAVFPYLGAEAAAEELRIPPPELAD
jgi:tetraprenyl-beta-curcumene synthase